VQRDSSPATTCWRGTTPRRRLGGLLEYAPQMAAHESARTTKLYDRRNDQVTLDQVAPSRETK